MKSFPFLRSADQTVVTLERIYLLFMNPNHYIACDLGAESGRVMLGRLMDGRLELEELHRFPSAAVQVLGSLRWDVLRIFEELKTGLRTLAQRNLPIGSLSVDSWGVDYVVINAVHPVLWPPFHYRDARTEETYDKVRASRFETNFCRNGHSVHVHQYDLPLGLRLGEKSAAA